MWPDPAKLQNKVAYYVKNYNSTFLQAVQGPWVWAFFGCQQLKEKIKDVIIKTVIMALPHESSLLMQPS